MIASKYTGTQEPIEYNGVTLSSNEVTIRASENNEWRVIFQKTKVNFIIIVLANLWGFNNISH